MTSSDIIAIVAVVVSAIVSIISVYISYRNNKANLLAKRTEIALEKQLEAFKVIAEKIYQIRKVIINQKSTNSPLDKTFVKNLNSVYEEFSQEYELLRIYLAPNLDDALDHFTYSVSRVIYHEGTDNVQDLTAKVLREHDDVISEIRKYIGIEQK